jgi:hypothetical protein
VKQARAIDSNEDLEATIIEGQLGARENLERLPLNEKDSVGGRKGELPNQIWQIPAKVVDTNGHFVVHQNGRITEAASCSFLLRLREAGEDERLDLSRSKHVVRLS